MALYYSLIHCHLVYANLIWSSTKENNYKSLFLKQKTAIRIVSSASYNAHTEPLFKQAKILPLPKLCLFFKLQFFFQFTQGFLPAALRNMWIRSRDRNPDNLYRLAMITKSSPSHQDSATSKIVPFIPSPYSGPLLPMKM